MINSNKKVLVAHVWKQHSFRVAEALKNEYMLYKYVTTVYDKPTSLLMRFVKKILGNNDIERANNRRCNALEDDEVIQFCEWQGFLDLAISRTTYTRLRNWWRRHYAKRFQKKLANYIIQHKDEICAVISYDLCSGVLFGILNCKTPEIIKIMDNAHPSRYYLHNLYKTFDCGQFGVTLESEGNGFLKKPELAKDETLKADYHIVASTFSKQADINTGVAEDKIFVCPYGVGNQFTENKKHRDYYASLKVLFVGNINQYKGIFQLLTVAKELYSSGVEFNVIGKGKDRHSYLYKPYEDYVNFYAHIPFSQLLDFYHTSHIFIFPTIGEGYGLVLLEALTAGLPVITTPNCAGRDVITDGYNGFIVEAGDIENLKEKILWFKDNLDKMQQMSKNAIESVKDMTWENYNKRLVAIAKEICNKNTDK